MHIQDAFRIVDQKLAEDKLRGNRLGKRKLFCVSPKHEEYLLYHSDGGIRVVREQDGQTVYPPPKHQD